jgi:capsule polysaccharide export protein KpsE/RkpR
MPELRDPGELNIAALLVPRWKTLLVCAVLGVGVGLAYTLIVPAWYEARLSVLPAQDGENGKLAKVAALGAAAGLSPSVSNDVQRIHSVMSSLSVADAVIGKFDLQERYGAHSLEVARKRLQEHCTLNLELKAGIVTLTCEDHDPLIARELTAYFGEVSNEVFARITVSTARGERKFLEEMVAKTKQDVDRSSMALREFQERHHVLDLPAQSKAVISAMATLEGDLISKRLQLSYLRGFASDEEPRVRQLSDQSAIEERELHRLESSNTESTESESAQFFPEALRVPGLRFELERLMRTQKIDETVYGMLTERLAMARVDEARDTAAFQILDAPTIPTTTSRPHRGRIAGIAAVAGLGAGVAFLIGPIWWRRRMIPVIKQESRSTKEIGS